MADISPSFERLPLATKRRIDAICARFDQAWREGRPRLEAFLGEERGEERRVLFAELVYIDIERRISLGEVPRASDYLGRFPGCDDLVREILPGGPPSAESGETNAESSSSSVMTPAARPGGAVFPPEVPEYEILGELGRGGMGVVYKARHLPLNRLVALKFIHAGRHTLPRYVERFRREAEVVARLKHPNIVQIYDIGEAEGQCFLALEYAEAGSLRDRLGGTALDPRVAAVLLEPIVRAVQHAHRQGVIHRDLKPANILLAPAGDSIAISNQQLPEYHARASDVGGAVEMLFPLVSCIPKLTDFGLAADFGRDTPGSEFGLAAGTPNYMAPEQALARGEGDPSADIWALGATLYEMLTGHPPFRAGTTAETVRLIIEVEPEPPRRANPEIPRELEAICLRCLQKDPARRYPGARELAQDLRRFLDGEPLLTRSPGLGVRAVKWVRKNPGVALVAALITVWALVCLAVVASGGFG